MPSHPPTRRSFARWTLLAAAGAPVFTSALHALASETTLLVFIHTDINVRAFEKELSACLPGVSVKAVSRYRDLESLFRTGTDAVLALQAVLNQLKLSVQAKGTFRGKTQEPYLLVSAGSPVDPKTVVRVGAVDILGHAGMKNFVAQVAGSAAKIKSVTKIQDLVPLLQLKAADAVLVPERYFSSLKTKTELKLYQVRVGGAGLPALSALTAKGRSIAPLLSKLTASINTQMGVTEWT